MAAVRSRFSGLEREPFVDQLHRLHRYVIAGRLERRTFDLVDPSVLGVPAQHRLALLVHQHDGHVAPVGDAVGDVGVPLPQRLVGGNAALAYDVAVLAHADKLAHVGLHVGAFAIVDGIALRGEPAHFGERAARNAVDLNDEVEAAIGIDALVGGHGTAPLVVGVRGPQADAHDHEFGRLHRGHAHEADQAALVDVRLRHGRAVAFDEERLFRLGAFERTVAPYQR